jgi:putative ABC transport system substrate-binding protein
VRRRDFIALLGGASAWPLAIRAQPLPDRPLIGLLSPVSVTAAARNVAAFRHGMRDLGYVEGHNVAFAFRFADGQLARLPELASELVALKPAAIAVGSALPSGPGWWGIRCNSID